MLLSRAHAPCTSRASPHVLQYEVYAEGLNGPVASPTVSQRSNVRRFVTSAAGAPGVVAEGQGTAGGVVQVRGPAGSWSEYELTLCTLRTGSCKKVPCSKAAQEPTSCLLTGLEDDSLYSVQVRWLLSSGQAGSWLR